VYFHSNPYWKCNTDSLTLRCQAIYVNRFDAFSANTRALDLDGTTAIGIFPQGASFYGVLDMTGNVFEWTLAEPGIGVAGTSPKKHWMLRGGLWLRDRDVAMTRMVKNSIPPLRSTIIVIDNAAQNCSTMDLASYVGCIKQG
jgi:hypothetical protein